MSAWKEAQAFERDWWGDCANTYQEESKHLDVAERLGLVAVTDHPEQRGRWPLYDLAGRSVVDVGGGPVSLLLKTVGGRDLAVVDPCDYPAWVAARYAAVGIAFVPLAGEDLDASGRGFDEAWVYNVLQHVEDPEAVVRAARRSAKLVRLFEWVGVPASDGHPHVLRADELSRWLGGGGATERLERHAATAFYGAFPGAAA